jgi:hypothetical protein
MYACTGGEGVIPESGEKVPAVDDCDLVGPFTFRQSTCLSGIGREMFVSPRRLRLATQNGNAILLQSIALTRLDPSIRSSVQAPQSRKLGSIAKIQALGKPAGAEEEEDDLLSSLTKRRGGRTKKGIQKISPKDWLLTEEGLKFRHPTIGRPNWLGDEIVSLKIILAHRPCSTSI